MKLPAILLMTFATLLAQTTAPTGSVSGRILDADSGAPLADFPVTNKVRTDAKGYYKITGIKPGLFEIQLQGERVWPALNVTTVNVAGGQDVTGVDIPVRLDGEISGRVLDQFKEPVSGVPVHVIGREYYAGALRYFGENSAITNDRGEYVLRNVRAGRAVLLLMETRKVYEQALSPAPADLQLRLPAYRATYYPNADSLEGASLVTLRSGEKRVRMDIQVLRSPGYCIDGTLTIENAPASLSFKVSDERTSSANLIPGSSSSSPIAVSSGPDGKIRLCDLYPGQFRIAALRRAGAQSDIFGATSVTIGKEDVHNVRVIGGPPATVPVEVGWEGTAPENASAAQFSLRTQSVTNDSMPAAGSRGGHPIPGPFSIQALRTVEYLLLPGIAPAATFPNAYVAGIEYGNSDILYQPFRAGEGTLRVNVRNDGGFLKVTAAPGVQILILPESAAGEAVLAGAMVSGEADNTGSYTSRSLAPGKYRVLALNSLIDRTPECIGAIWRARARGQEVDLGPNATAGVTLLDVVSLK